MKMTTLLAAWLEHRRNAHRPRTQIEARQLRRFRRLVAHVRRHSPYYRELIAERGIDLARCRPKDFPVLTKAQVVRHFDRMVTDPRITREVVTAFLERSRDPGELLHGAYYVVHTSGSTGEPAFFVYSQADWSRGIAHAMRVNPMRPGRVRLAYFGAAGGHFTGVSFALCSRNSLLRHKYRVAVFDVNRPLEPILEGLDRFRPDILMGYPSSLAVLAERQRSGALAIAPDYVQSSGEPVNRAERALIESAFGRTLLNTYASTEHLIMGLERPEYGGMYLFEDDLIFERRPDHTLVTNLFNRTLPLIRYRMSDVLEPLEDRTHALPFTLIRPPAGRSEHIPRFLNRHGEEDFLSPHVIIELFIPGVQRFQLKLVDSTACRLRVCLEQGLDTAAQATALQRAHTRLSEVFAAKEMDNVRITVERRDQLSPDPRTGKFRLIVPVRSE